MFQSCWQAFLAILHNFSPAAKKKGQTFLKRVLSFRTAILRMGPRKCHKLRKKEKKFSANTRRTSAESWKNYSASNCRPWFARIKAQFLCLFKEFSFILWGPLMGGKLRRNSWRLHEIMLCIRYKVFQKRCLNWRPDNNNFGSTGVPFFLTEKFPTAWGIILRLCYICCCLIFVEALSAGNF